MQRIVVVGSSGAGKTTLAREIARRKSAPYVELDALHWKANWVATSADELRVLVTEATAESSWVLDGNYSMVRDITWARADTIVWLDYAFPVVFRQVLKRTLRRAILREELWNGNRESWRLMFSRDSLLWWVITTYGKRRREITEALAQPEFTHLQVVHFRSPRATQNWLKLMPGKEFMGLKDDLKEYYTVGELAAVLRMTDVAIEKLAHGGEIAHDIVGAAIRIPRHEAEKLLGKRRRAKIRRAGLAGLGLLAALAGGVAAAKLRNRDDADE